MTGRESVRRLPCLERPGSFLGGAAIVAPLVCLKNRCGTRDQTFRMTKDSVGEHRRFATNVAVARTPIFQSMTPSDAGIVERIPHTGLIVFHFFLFVSSGSMSGRPFHKAKRAAEVQYCPLGEAV